MPLLNNVVKIENTEFIRDMNNKAVLNTDAAGLVRYKEARKKALSAKQDTLDTKKRLAHVEQEMVDLKKMVGDLLRSRG